MAPVCSKQPSGFIEALLHARGPAAPVRRAPLVAVVTAEWTSIGLVFESSLKLEMFGASSLFVVFVYPSIRLSCLGKWPDLFPTATILSSPTRQQVPTPQGKIHQWILCLFGCVI